jgi:menaquinone reductase, molybdopterin-binding-like subunit
MSTKITRREVLQFVGGSALGLLLSPIPWKVLDDTANWTQNWPWTPKPIRGDIAYRTGTCTLCQAACGMRSRTVGSQPVSTSGQRRHPLSHGALCTTGILAHHLRYHPARVKRPVKISANAEASTDIALSDALQEIGRALKQSPSVVILDERPGRAVSDLYRELTSASTNIRYVPCRVQALSALNTLSQNASLEAGYDLDNAHLILSFGAPLFDGWGSPSRTSAYLDKRASQTVVQVEPLRSRTAELATRWIASRPGSDTALALSIARVMCEERLASAQGLRAITDIDDLAQFLAAFSPDAVSTATGVPAGVIREAAHAFASQGPSVAITAREAAPETRAAAMLLNILAGSVGTAGGIMLREEIPSDRSAASMKAQASLLEELPDHSVNVFILDESLSGSSIPDALLRRKLAADRGIIVSLSPFVTPRPFALQYVIPSTVMFETLTDVPGPFDTALASLAVSAALLPAPDGTMDAVSFAQKLAQSMGASLSATGTTEELLKKRIASVHASKRGSVFSASSMETQEMKQLASADDLWSALAEGGCWIDTQSARPSQLSFRVMPSLKDVTVQGKGLAADPHDLLVFPLAEMNAYAGTAVSPLMSKLSQESALRFSGRQAYVNPATALAHGIVQGEMVALRTKNGTMNVQASIDARTMPDVIFVSTPAGNGRDRTLHTGTNDIRLLCELNTSGAYTPTPVTIQKVSL